MNRIYNTWIFIISLLTIPFAYLVGINQLYGAFGANTTRIAMQYQDIVFGVAGVLVFLIGTFRSSRKWGGIRIVNKIKRFQFSSEISEERTKRVVVVNMLEMVAFFFIAVILVVFCIHAVYVSLIYIVFIADFIWNTFRGVVGKKYRVGMTKKAIVAVDREVIPIYFKGLKRITKERDMLYFEYVNDLVLDFQLTTVPNEKQEEFIQLLRKNVDDSKVFFSGFEEEND